jgi:hypothetical protein
MMGFQIKVYLGQKGGREVLVTSQNFCKNKLFLAKFTPSKRSNIPKKSSEMM